MTRKKSTPATDADVLERSRRRCALCFGLNGVLRERKGQLAHIDRDPSNSVADNLAFLCLYHHSEYDSRSLQSKGFTPEELRRYRDRLYRELEEGGLPPLEHARRSREIVFLTLESPSIEAGKLDLTLKNEGSAFNIQTLQVLTPDCSLLPWYPASVPVGAQLRLPTQLPRTGAVECCYKMTVQDRSGAIRAFTISVDPRPSPARFRFEELF